MTGFEFATANRIIFGRGSVRRIGEVASSLGRKAFVITGSQALKASGKLEIVQQALRDSGVLFSLFAASGEPEIETVGRAVERAREEGCDLVIGVGGGSVIDLAKATAALLTNEGVLLDYLEVIGRGQALRSPAAPLLAVPTTAGTGAEVTANAVMKDLESRQKASLRSPFLLPRVALVDPELTHTLPPEITAQSGLDALAHLLEAYVSRKSQPLADALCRDGISRIGRSLVSAYDNGADQDAREEMALASLEGGIALANAGLGAVHGIAAVLGGSYRIPHGVACACLLPSVWEANTRKLRLEETGSHVLRRYLEISTWLAGESGGTQEETIESGRAFLRDLNRHLKVAPLSRFGVQEDDLPEIARKSAQASSTRANPVSFSQEELRQILGNALG